MSSNTFSFNDAVVLRSFISLLIDSDNNLAIHSIQMDINPRADEEERQWREETRPAMVNSFIKNEQIYIIIERRFPLLLSDEFAGPSPIGKTILMITVSEMSRLPLKRAAFTMYDDCDREIRYHGLFSVQRL